MPDVVCARLTDVGNGAVSSAAVCVLGAAADKLGYEPVAFFEVRVAAAHIEHLASERGGLLYRIAAVKTQERDIPVSTCADNARAFFTVCVVVQCFELFKEFGRIAPRLNAQFPAHAVSADYLPDFKIVLYHQSISTATFSSQRVAAARITVRIALAILPCLPITLPMSFSLTWR